MLHHRHQGSKLLALALGVAGTFCVCASGQAAVITFDTTAANAGNPFVEETDMGFTIDPTLGSFFYSGPTPPNDVNLANSIYDGPTYSPTNAELVLTSASGSFDFTSVDLASRTGTSTYAITGFSGGAVAFSVTGSLTNNNTFVAVDATAAEAATPITSLDVLLAPGKGATAINVDNIAVTAVPEPMTTSLVGLGGIALAAFGWRRRLA